jgi:ribosomal protein S18 acetylase RimI-like enzyme
MPEKMIMNIRPYQIEDESQVIGLWGGTVADAAAHNDPALAIRLKMTKDPHLFLVATVDNTVVGTVMGGFDGHRGWLYSLAVASEHRRRGIATALVQRLEAQLVGMGCMKVNLQVRGTKSEALGFYERVGYCVEDRVSLGKRLYDKEDKA